jgi:uncharacterized phage protein (TIGR01671 family)
MILSLERGNEMREIKFRAWHYEEGNPLYVPEMRYSQSYSLSLFFQNVDSEPCSVEIMQYTGLKDKNGVEIYEGDIIAQCYDEDLDDDEETTRSYHSEGAVAWFDSLYWDGGGSTHSGYYCKQWFKYDEDGELSYHDSFDRVVVLGNIYENPELLEGQNENR